MISCIRIIVSNIIGHKINYYGESLMICLYCEFLSDKRTKSYCSSNFL